MKLKLFYFKFGNNEKKNNSCKKMDLLSEYICILIVIIYICFLLLI